LKTTRANLDELGISIVPVRRGGAITFHGPGQITGYPLFDLEYFKTDIRWYIEGVADGVIETLAHFGIKGYYDSEYPGVWIADEHDGSKRKICAMGVHLSRWVSIHGFALNVTTDMSLYDNFVPCAIDVEDRSVTSMERELGENINLALVKSVLVNCIANSFETNAEDLPVEELENNLSLLELHLNT
jgi:lipoyl(octanoyl) transferase